MLLNEAKEILSRNGYIMEQKDELLEKVRQRTLDHIERVKYFYKLMLQNNKIPEQHKNYAEVQKHDSDKLEKENLTDQALRYKYRPEELTPEIERRIQNVVREHVKTNKHHCEYWGNGDQRTLGMDCSKMPLKYVYEMLADWAATAEERGGTIDSWFRSSVIEVGGKRWHFSKEIINTIEDIIPWLDSKIDKSLKRDYGLTFIDPAFLKKRG